MIRIRPYLLRNTIQHYPWGKKGRKAFIPQLIGIDHDEDLPFAELWMGAHPKAPSEVVFDKYTVPLNTLVSEYPRIILGDNIMSRFSGEFPFLFKVLSVEEPLSIQVHPNKFQAENLHKLSPNHYPDQNHKPELSIAFDNMTALVGFKSSQEVIQTLGKYPEITDFLKLGNENLISISRNVMKRNDSRRFLHDICTDLVNGSIHRYKQFQETISMVCKRIEDLETITEEEKLFLKLRIKYPNDVGLIFVFLLKMRNLMKDQALYIMPGVPHAYIKGNIIECMSSSDNVVRLGITSKYVDSKALINILDYTPNNVPAINIKHCGKEEIFQSPASEFLISIIRPREGEEIKIKSKMSPEIMLIAEGVVIIRWEENDQHHDISLQQGQSVLIPAILNEYSILSKQKANIYRVVVPD